MTPSKAPVAAPLLLALAVAGCGGGATPPPASDPEAARAALTSALDTWKAGGTPADLAARTPPIRVADEDWLAGRRLADYRLRDPGALVGPSLRCPVTLELAASGTARPTRLDVVYTVATEPGITVVRQDDY